MGTPKPLIQWFGAPLIQRQIEALLDAGVDEVFAVTGNRADEIKFALEDFAAGMPVHLVNNKAFLEGKTTSVKAGLKRVPTNVKAIVVLAVDQPRPTWLIREVLESHKLTGALISSPVYDGHGGPPLVFDGSLLNELKAITEEGQGVREVVQAHIESMNRHSIDTPIVRLDMNTQEDVVAARDIFPDPRLKDS